MGPDKHHSTDQSIEKLLEAFKGANARKRRGLINSLEDRSNELASLGLSVMSSFDRDGDDWAPGLILQILYKNQNDFYKNSLLNEFPKGWLSTYSAVDIDYSPLQEFLLQNRFQEADRFTSSKLRELAGPSAESRGYVYFTEVDAMPGVDLVTLDRLWIAYSQGKFGFTVQSKILDSIGGRYEKLWPRIGWKKDGIWTRYPSSFNWSIEAPEGHMPLVNQLRGVRLMHSILNHPALLERR